MNRRLMQFLAAENISQAAFADRINVARASVSHILKGRNKPGYDFFVGIIKSFPTLNLEWLLTGKGKMYKTEDPQPESASVVQESHKSADFDLFSAPGDSHEDTGESSGQPETADVPDDMPDSMQDYEDDSHTSVRQRKVARIIVFYDNGTFEEFSR